MEQTDQSSNLMTKLETIQSAEANLAVAAEAYAEAILAVAAAFALPDDVPPPPPVQRWQVIPQMSCTVGFARGSEVVLPDENSTLEEGVYIVAVSYEDGAGQQSGITEFTLSANVNIGWSGGVQINIIP